MSGKLLSVLDASKYCDLRLLECGRERCIPNKQFTYTQKEYHLFHFILSGKGRFEINGREKMLGKGEVFYIPPHCAANYSPSENEPWQYIWLGFDGQMADFLLNACGISANHPVFACGDVNLKAVLEQLWDRYRAIGGLDIVCLGFAYQIFGQMILSVSEKSAKMSTKEIYVNDAKEFIAYNFQFNIRITDIAKNIGVNPNYLSNIFKEIEGISPKKYLTQIRMKRASALLLLENKKIKEVGEAVGYINQLHFSAEFKKTFGVSPQEYINNAKTERKDD